MTIDAKTREGWLLRRRSGIGSSDAAAIVGKSPWRTPLHVYLDKLGQLDDSDSEPKKWGRRLEEVVAQAYAEETGAMVAMPRDDLIVDDTNPELFASLDRMALRSGDPVERILECKTSESDDGWGQEGTDDIPSHYLIQVQHQMMVTGFRVADVAVLIGGNRLRVYSVRMHADYCAMLRRIELDFWAKVVSRTPPAVDWEHPSSVELVKKMHPVTDGKCVELDDAAVLLARECLLLGDDAKRIDAKRSRMRGELMCMMGDAQLATLPDGTRFVRKQVHRPLYVARATAYTTFTIRPSQEMKNSVQQIGEGN